ncbi:TCF3 fusion partner [Protopterus annectens]|uniref:TCF3 fusion partner n=1 Tax=Protopterus annectens TaxID=7888 RepID=UPI001CFC129F|nr:TCF3 fusion partner [Protopterus annectens]XP_043935484.1 TCF3 fusion partner [Protopterus annectens]XP_043935491.1 TCF3 fusion partner [Protopterus annectens]XP_043935498.1 TCF3 fusion partner [Protopterus annectens]
MAAVGFEEFSAPLGSDLALPPLFGGNILESELDTEVEFVDAGMDEESHRDEEEEILQRQQELYKKKYQVLSRRCKEIEQVNEKLLNRLNQVQKITRRLKKERKFLMRTLQVYGDDYRKAQLTILLEEDGNRGEDILSPVNAENEPLEGESTLATHKPRIANSRSAPDSRGSESPSVTDASSAKKKKKLREEREVSSSRKPSHPFSSVASEHPIQLKLEEDMSCEPGETSLTQSWQSSSPVEERVHYSDYSSPTTCPDFE